MHRRLTNLISRLSTKPAVIIIFFCAFALLAGSTSASAAPPSAVQPPELSKPQYTCHAEGAIVAVELSNPNQTELSFQVTLSGGEIAQAQVVTLAAQAEETAEFHGIPSGKYRIQVFNDVGDIVARTKVRVKCPSL